MQRTKTLKRNLNIERYKVYINKRTNFVQNVLTVLEGRRGIRGLMGELEGYRAWESKVRGELGES